jgi:hypothetical protein
MTPHFPITTHDNLNGCKVVSMTTFSTSLVMGVHTDAIAMSVGLSGSTLLIHAATGVNPACVWISANDGPPLETHSAFVHPNAA